MQENSNISSEGEVRRHLFSNEEIDRLMVIAASGGTVTLEQIYQFIKHCERMRATEMTLEAILSGMVTISHITESDYKMSLRDEPIPQLAALS